jgi:hypothetical protein
MTWWLLGIMAQIIVLVFVLIFLKGPFGKK